MASLKHDVFISYARSSGSALAQVFRAGLEHRGIRVFLDVHADYWGAFPEELAQRIRATPFFLVLLTPGCLESHWMQQELALAFDARRKILVVCESGFQVPSAVSLNDVWSRCMRLNHRTYVHEYSDSVVNQVVEAIRPRSLVTRRLLAPALAVCLFLGSMLYFDPRSNSAMVPESPPASKKDPVAPDPARIPAAEDTVAKPVVTALSPVTTPKAHNPTPAQRHWCFYKSGYDPLLGANRTLCVELRSREECALSRTRALNAGGIWTSAKECAPCRCASD